MTDSQTKQGKTSPILLSYQQRWLADKHPVKVIEKSRRVGISWAEAADSALQAAARDGADSWYLGYNQDMAEEFILDVAFWARTYNLAVSETQEVALKDEDKDILAYRVRFASGRRVTALSSRPSNLRGKQGRIIIDEAAFHESLDELLKASIALTMWGGSVAIISSHNGVDNPFNQLVNDIRAGRKPGYSLHRVTLYDAVEQGLYRRICLKQGEPWTEEGEQKWVDELLALYGEDAQEELLCVPAKGDKVYLPSFLVERCMSDESTVLRLKLPDSFTFEDEFTRTRQIKTWLDVHLTPILQSIAELRTYYGLDFARSGDLSAIAVLVEEQNLRRRCPVLIELRNVPFKQQQQILFALVDNLKNFQGGAHDARGNGQMLAELACDRYGSRVESVMTADSWYLANFPRYKALLEEGAILLPRDSDVLADHRAVRVENGIPKVPASARFKGSDGGMRHGDTAIAFCLAAYSALNQSRGSWEDAVVCGPTRAFADFDW